MGSGFESQGAHLKENPADSSESAGFLRSPLKCSFRGLRSRGSALFLMVRAACFLRAYAGAPVTRTLRPSLLRCGRASVRHPEGAWRKTRRATDVPPPAPLRICGSGALGIPPVRWGARWFRVCAPCLANWGGGRLSPFSVLLGGLVFCVWACESPPQL